MLAMMFLRRQMGLSETLTYAIRIEGINFAGESREIQAMI